MNPNQKTNFRLVSEMNEAYTNPKGDPNAIDAKRLYKQCTNIASEFAELMKAFGTRVEFTFTENAYPRLETALHDIRDALCDIHVFAYGAHHFMGYDADADMYEVVDAVMTRFCKTPEQLAATLDKYNKLGVRYDVCGNAFPYMHLKSSMDQGVHPDTKAMEYPKGKFLKAVGYREPIFYEAPKPVVTETPADVINEMQAARAVNMQNEKLKREIVSQQVEEYRRQLEAEAFPDTV